MEEFSAASGISRPTLSRFFNDPTSVSPASRARIATAMKRFAYRPNLFALNFNRRNPRTLGLLVPSLADPFYAGLVQRIEKLAQEAGYWTIVQNAHGDETGEAQALATLMSLKVAGAIVVPLGHVSRTAGFRELTTAMPVVFMDSRLDLDGSFVGTDNRRSVGLMVDYLLRTGEAPFYFDMPDINQNARERRSAYVAAMEQGRAEPLVHRSGEKGWEFERIAFEEAGRLFAGGGPRTGAIVCANDRVAFGVMAAASQAELPLGRAGGNLRIAGHDDHPLSRFSCPSLTTVAQDHETLAATALDLVMSAISSGVADVREHRLDATLMVRASA